MELDRFDWLGLRREEAVDPDRVIVDAHHHLWDRGGSTYLAPQLLEDMTGTHNVVESVFVECMAGYDSEREPHMQPVGETVFVAGEADAADALGGPRIAGIVSHADMRLGDAVEEVLAAHDAAGGGRFRGIRHATGWDPSDEVHNSHSRPFEHMMGTAEFGAGVRTLAEMGFSFDAWLFHPQLPELAALAGAVPELTIVLNHLGGPLGVGPYGRGREQGPRRLAGLNAAGGGLPETLSSRWAGSAWTSTSAPVGRPSTPRRAPRRWPSTGATTCGSASTPSDPDRCMFESNFPVDRQALTYPVLWNALQIMADGYSDAEQDEIFSGTATRAYKLS